MILGIDASNIRGGGGVTHLVELLRHANPRMYNFEKVIVWSGYNTLVQLVDKPWLEKKEVSLLNKSLFHRVLWQKLKLTKQAKFNKCDVLFVPGGSYSGTFSNVVSMSQNLLPFEWKEMRRYGLSLEFFRLLFLRFNQSKTFLGSKGVIFLTYHAREVVLKQFKIKLENTKVIYHGINRKFFLKPRLQRNISQCSESNPFKILYVSFVGEYKHQWNVVKAFSIVKQKGYPIQLTLVGDPVEKKANKKLIKSIKDVPEFNSTIHHISNINYEKIQELYRDSDLFLFASTCETFGQIVTEAMASGLPIISTNHPTLQELLSSETVYFNPESPEEIANALESSINDINYRITISAKHFQFAKSFQWEKCARETFSFFQKTLKI